MRSALVIVAALLTVSVVTAEIQFYESSDCSGTGAPLLFSECFELDIWNPTRSAGASQGFSAPFGTPFAPEHTPAPMNPFVFEASPESEVRGDDGSDEGSEPSGGSTTVSSSLLSQLYVNARTAPDGVNITADIHYPNDTTCSETPFQTDSDTEPISCFNLPPGYLIDGTDYDSVELTSTAYVLYPDYDCQGTPVSITFPACFRQGFDPRIAPLYESFRPPPPFYVYIEVDPPGNYTNTYYPIWDDTCSGTTQEQFGNIAAPSTNSYSTDCFEGAALFRYDGVTYKSGRSAANGDFMLYNDVDCMGTPARTIVPPACVRAELADAIDIRFVELANEYVLNLYANTPGPDCAGSPVATAEELQFNECYQSDNFFLLGSGSYNSFRGVPGTGAGSGAGALVPALFAGLVSLFALFKNLN